MTSCRLGDLKGLPNKNDVTKRVLIRIMKLLNKFFYRLINISFEATQSRRKIEDKIEKKSRY